MATCEEKVKAIHPKATAKQYRSAGGETYYLIWSQRFERGERLGSGKTKRAAFEDAMAKL